MKKLTIIFIFFFSVSLLTFHVSHIYSQQPTLEWVKRYPDSVYSHGAVGYAMALDSDGNLYVTGSYASISVTSVCTIKYSPGGEPLWVNNFTGTNIGNRQAYAVAVDKNSNVYISGTSYNPGSSYDYCTIKYDSKGAQQWVQYYSGPSGGDDYVQKIAIDNANNIYVTGCSSAGGMVDFQIATIKYTPDGRQIWVKRYGTNDATTYANGIAVDDDCNIYITGSNNDSAVTIKYDSSGVQQWAKSYTGNSGLLSQANSIVLDIENNIYITGYSYGVSGTSEHIDFFTVKYSSNGIQDWAKRYNPDSATYDSKYVANTVKVDNLGDVYVSGFFEPNEGSSGKLCTIKYSINGDLLWVQKDTSRLSNETTIMAIDKYNCIYVNGSYATLSNNGTIATIKYNSSGSVMWKEVYIGAYAFDILVDENINIYLTGYGLGGMVTLKYSQPIGIQSISSEIPGTFKLFQNYPNPFNPTTKIKFSLPNPSKGGALEIKLIVYDLPGRVIATLVNENLKPGEYETEWNASNFASGVYFYQLQAGTFRESKKMLLIK